MKIDEFVRITNEISNKEDKEKIFELFKRSERIENIVDLALSTDGFDAKATLEYIQAIFKMKDRLSPV